MISTERRVGDDLISPLIEKDLSTGEYLGSIKTFFNDSMKKAIDPAINERDEKLALATLLLRVVRPSLQGAKLPCLTGKMISPIDHPPFVRKVEEIEGPSQRLEVRAQDFAGGLFGEDRRIPTDKLPNKSPDLSKKIAELLSIVEGAPKDSLAAILERRAKKEGFGYALDAMDGLISKV